jgi:hypothetical protein
MVKFSVARRASRGIEVPGGVAVGFGSSEKTWRMSRGASVAAVAPLSWRGSSAGTHTRLLPEVISAALFVDRIKKSTAA